MKKQHGAQLRHVFFLKEATLPETNGLPVKLDGWNTRFLLGPGLFSGALAVSFSESYVYLYVLRYSHNKRHPMT